MKSFLGPPAGRATEEADLLGERGRRAVLLACLVAAPALALAPAAPAQDGACAPEGQDLVCVWEGELAAGLPEEPGEGDECLRTTPSMTRPATLFRHGFHVPFPASVAVHLATRPGLNEVNLFLEGRDGVINRSYANTPPQVFHRLAHEGDLVVRGALDNSGYDRPTAPAVLPETYRLEARITPALPGPAPFAQDDVVSLDSGQGFNDYRIVCGALVAPWAIPVDGPALVAFDVDMPTPGLAVVLPDESIRMVLNDAIGRVVADFRATPSLGAFGVFAAEGFGWGDWYLTFMLDDRVGVGDPFQVPVSIRSDPLGSAGLTALAPIPPAEPLLADPSGDTTDETLDVLSAWFSDDTPDALAFHVQLAEVPGEGLAPPEGSRRYETAWRYADSRVVLVHEPEADGPGSYEAFVEGANARRLSTIAGAVTPGRPGVLSFLAPKAFIGSPLPGQPLEEVVVSTYEVRGEPFHAVPPLPPPLGGAVVADETVGNATFVLRTLDPEAFPETPLRPAAVSAAGPWGPLSSVNGLVGIASALAAGAVGAAALLQRRNGRP